MDARSLAPVDRDMQLEGRSTAVDWDGIVPTALDWRVVAVVLAVAAVAASVNVPYGGLPFAAAAFALLAGGGVVGHVLGERRLRRITAGLVERWVDSGARIDAVTRSVDATGTEWTVHTSNGSVVVRGLAFAPISTVRIARDGTGDTLSATDAEARLDALADEWYRELFDGA